MHDVITKKATIFVQDGEYTDQFILGQIDITHLFMKRVKTYRNEHLVLDDLGNEKLDDEFIRRGVIYHVGEFNGSPSQVLYDAIWPWLKGEAEINERTYRIG